MDRFKRELGNAMQFVLDLVECDPDATNASIYVDVKDKGTMASASADFLDGSHFSQTLSVSANAYGEDTEDGGEDA